MLNYEAENNYSCVLGTVVSEITLGHEIYDEKFYSFKLKCQRLSESFDIINITASERLLTGMELIIGSRVEITGQFRSYNNYSQVGNKLILTLFAKNIEEIYYEEADKNEIRLDGYVCKQPVYRVTPFGREITDILIAVNRIHNKSDYIPLITWGRNAKYASNLSVGDHIKIVGRIQSRDYVKKLEDETEVTKTAFEVSVGKIDIVN